MFLKYMCFHELSGSHFVEKQMWICAVYGDEFKGNIIMNSQNIPLLVFHTSKLPSWLENTTASER